MNLFRLSVLSVSVGLFSMPMMAEENRQYQSLLEPLVETGTDIIGQPIVYPEGEPTVTAAVVTIPPGTDTSWHIHEVPLFVRILEGEVSVDYGEKGVKTFKAGDSFMEAMNHAHNATNKGDVPVRIMAVYFGAHGKANAALAEAAQ